MSEQSEKLVKIVMPDLLNYLEMLKSGEIIEKWIEKNKLINQKEGKMLKLRKKIENKKKIVEFLL